MNNCHCFTAMALCTYPIMTLLNVEMGMATAVEMEGIYSAEIWPFLS